MENGGEYPQDGSHSSIETFQLVFPYANLRQSIDGNAMTNSAFDSSTQCGCQFTASCTTWPNSAGHAGWQPGGILPPVGESAR